MDSLKQIKIQGKGKALTEKFTTLEKTKVKNDSKKK